MVTHLPDDMVEKITSFLPVKIAARATLFSRKLTSSWRQNRNLCFIQREGNEHVELINDVMSQHLGSKIDRLALRLNAAGHEDQIYSWIQTAVTKGVEELDLDFGEPTVLISSHLMDSESSKIGVLKLASCDVKFSGQLKGFRFLKTLGFRNITIQQTLMKSISENCLALENLEIRDCRFQFRRLNILAGLLDHFKTLKLEHSGENCIIFIYSQTLEEFTYSGELCGIVFERPVPRTLASISITYLPSQASEFVPATRLMDAMRYCTNLQICGKIIQGLFPESSGEPYKNHPWEFSGLKVLTLFLNAMNIARTGTSIITPCDIVYFLQKCPILEKLFIDLGECPFGWFWRLEAEEMFEMSPLHFRSLKSVTIKGFKYRNIECQLLRMIVKHAPSLRSVSLFKSTVNGDSTSDRDLQLCFAWMKAQRCIFDVHPPM